MLFLLLCISWLYSYYSYLDLIYSIFREERSRVFRAFYNSSLSYLFSTFNNSNSYDYLSELEDGIWGGRDESCYELRDWMSVYLIES